MKELKRETEVYKVDTEEAAAALIEEFKNNAISGDYQVTKYESKYRNKKVKGEIVEEFYVVTIQKDYNIEE
ncbi:MAG: hypothetical protein M0R38_13060 [Bacteroidia bacterium]|nr:hypothetical protein [Bacteroidia bacterium]